MFDFVSKIINAVVGSKAARDLKELSPYVQLVNDAYSRLQQLSNDELRAKTAQFKNDIQQYIEAEENEIAALKKEAETTPATELEKIDAIYKKIDKLHEKELEKIEEKLEEILPAAFAVVKETARRFKENAFVEVTATEMDRDLAATKTSVTIKGDKALYAKSWLAAGTEVSWEMLHYDVQMIGGAVIHKGKIAEMATGEGKTLVATLPVYLNALAGKGVHVVTVNDYLAKRDSEWMGTLFEFHGLRVDCIDKHEPNSPQRRNAYLADITYGTNNEFGFDYLRDNMAREPEDLVQRKHHFAIVDEVDSVLIDDARTPLIISGPTPKGDKHEFHEMKPRVEKLVNAQRKYINTVLVDAKKLLQADGNGKVSKDNEEKGGLALLRAYRGLPKNNALIKFLSEPGIKQILLKTENHYMQDQSKEMHKVDAELYFTIDEKNNSIELTDKGIDLITENSEDSHFFIIPDIASELALLEKENLSDKELLLKKDKVIQDYTVKAERIHTVNQLLKAYTLFEKDVEYVLMDGKIKIVDEQTGRIMEGRRYSDGLHQAIEAKENVRIEAATQTYATITLQNYFRMYHKLAGMTGTAETEAGEFWDIYKLDVVVIPTNKPITRKDNEDMVYKTRREKYKAVIDEIEKLVKEGRPVLVGTTSVEISEQLSRTLKMKNIKHNVLNAKLHQKEADIVAEAGKSGAVTIATNMAGRGTDIKLGEGVKDKGGLAIVGTERHDSRRVDRQLRGRSGRQGDPGSSQFFVSLEDELMRLFGSERIAKLMDRMGLEEGEVIQHSMITRSIERAQRKVEENNFGIRKRLLEYDDVMNSQRSVIYDRRKHALFGDRLDLDIANMLMDHCEGLIAEHKELKDYQGLKLEIIRTLSVEAPFTEDEFNEIAHSELADKLYHAALSSYERKKENIAQTAFPVIKNVFEEQGAQFQNIVIPFTDGLKQIQVVCNLKAAYDTEGKEAFKAFEKGVSLAMIDNYWKEHLREMDDLKQSVQGAVYEQKDPLLIYKFEAFELFKQLLGKINRDVITFLMKGNLPANEQTAVKQAPVKSSGTQPRLQTSRSDAGTNLPQPGMPQQQPVQKTAPVRVEKKVGRNDPCPCGSGKKFKQCHGKGE